MNYNFTVNEQLITCDQEYIVADSVNFCQANFYFDTSWDGYTKTVLFTNLKKEINKSYLLDETNQCFIPWEVLKHLGPLNIYVRGDKENSVATVARMCCPLPILKSGASKDVDFENMPTPDIYNQILTRLQEVEVGGLTAEQFDTFLTENENFLNVSSQGYVNTANIANLTSQIGEIDNGIHLLDEQVQGIGLQLREQLSTTNNLSEKINNNTLAIEKLDGEMSNAQLAINQIMNSQTQLGTRVSINENKIEVLEDKVSELEVNLPIQPDPEDPEAPVVPDQEFQNLKKQVNKNTINIAAQETTINQTLEKTELNTTEIATVKNNVDTNTTSILSNSEKILALENSVNTNTSNIEKNATELSQLTVDFDNATTNIATLQNEVKTNTANITTNTTEIETLKQQIQDISSVAGIHSAKLLFTGEANQANTDYTLSDNINNYDYLYLTINWLSETTGYSISDSQWLKSSEILLGEENILVASQIIKDNGDNLQLDYLYSFKENNILHCNDITTSSTTSQGITKIIGVQFIQAEDVGDEKLKALEQRIASLETLTNNQGQSITNLSNQYNELNSSYNNLSQQYTELTSKVETNKESIETLNTLNTQVENNTSSINTLNTTVDTLSTSVTSLTQLIQTEPDEVITENVNNILQGPKSDS